MRDLATIVVVERPVRAPADAPPGWRWRAVEVPSLEVSSTDLRARAVDGRPLDYLVTHEVADWIEAHGLYRGRRDDRRRRSRAGPAAGAAVGTSCRATAAVAALDAVFSSLLAVAVVAGARPHVRGREDRARRAAPGKSVSTVTDPTAPGFEALPRADADARSCSTATGRALRSIAVLALNSGDVGGSVAAGAPGHCASATGEAPTRSAVVAGLRRGPDGDAAGACRRSLGFGITEVGGGRRRPVGRAGGAGRAAARSRTPTTVGRVPRRAAHARRPTRSARTSPRAATGESAAGAAAPPASCSPRRGSTPWPRSGDPAAVPGEVESGIGRFVRGPGRGPRRVATRPGGRARARSASGARATTSTPTADGDARRASSCRSRPPATPGGRVRVRLLDGTGDPEHVQRVAPLVVPGRRGDRRGRATPTPSTTRRPRSGTTTRRSSGGRRALREALGAGARGR